MNDEILKLAKECGIYSDTAFYGINKFAQEIRNRALERAAVAGWLASSPDCEDKVARAIRALKEKK